MTVRRLQGLMPAGLNHLLIQSAIAPAGQAADAWGKWSASRSLDEAGWAEVRLLPTIAARSDELGIAPELLPRLDGIRRFVWAKSQKQMIAARPLLELFSARGISLLLLKGAAVMASNREVMGQRFLRDVDLLVPWGQAVEAVRLAVEAGWKNPFYTTFEEAAHLGLERMHALEFKGGNGGEVDLHRHALAPNFLPGDDDGLWERSSKTFFLNLPCRIPSVEDHLVHALEHSVRRDPDRVLDWAVDASRLIDGGQVDWELVQKIVMDRGLAVPVEARLRYLREACAVDVPTEVVDWLSRYSMDRVYINEYLSQQFGGLKMPGHRRRARIRAAMRRAREVLSRKKKMPGPDVPSALDVGQKLDGRRIDLSLPNSSTRKLRIRIRPALPVLEGWRCLVHCGPVRLSSFSSGESLWAKIQRFFYSRVTIQDVLLQAQETRQVSLYLDFRGSGGSTVSPPVVECTAKEMDDESIQLTVEIRHSECPADRT
jgi:hypothetical protein